MAEDYLNDTLMDVESGIEALEDTMDDIGVTYSPPISQPSVPLDTTTNRPPSTPNNFGIPPSQTNLKEKVTAAQPKIQILNLTMYILTCFLIVNYFLFPDCDSWNGFLLGVWFVYLASNIKNWVLDNFFSDREPVGIQLKRSSAIPAMYTIPSVKEHKPLKKYEVGQLTLKFYIVSIRDMRQQRYRARALIKTLYNGLLPEC